MHAGFFDVLHDAADNHIRAVGERVHVHFRGFFKELVDQHGARRAHQSGLRHVVLHGVDVIGDDHGTAAEHVARAHQHRQTNFPGYTRGFLGNQRRRVARLRNLQFFKKAAEAPAIFG